MNMPPLLLGGALVFWGWHAGLWWLGPPLAVLAELPRVLDWRWELELKDRQRVADLCSLLGILTGLYLYFTEPRLGDALILLVRGSPALLFPLLAVQLYEGRPGVERAVLYLSLRGGRPGGEVLVDLRPSYLLICLLAAAMLPPPSVCYYPGLALIAALALWPQRPPGRGRARWALPVALAVVLGLGLAVGLQRAQLALEDWVINWLAGEGDDPFRARTAIGEMGELKLSERILIRVWPQAGAPPPPLLRLASYDRYLDGTWLGGAGTFAPLTQEGRDWRLPGPGAAPRRVAVSLELDKGQGLLPLPGGARAIQGLEGAQLTRHPLGAVKVLDGPPLADYRIAHGASFAEAPPGEADGRVPLAERPAMARLVAELGLAGLPAGEVLGRVATLFNRDFRYSLELTGPPPGRGALEHFLLHQRAGHCEYFASAAVLLLRQAGIPARYARGWSVQEYSELEGAYLARARHAHAWVLVWVDGVWRDFDPTPPDWGALEAAQRPWWGPLLDRWAHWRFQRARDGGQGQERAWLAWGLPPLALLLAWRIARRGRRRSLTPQARPNPALEPSPFAPVERVLGRGGGARRPGETLADWLDRLRAQGDARAGELLAALGLYYRERFDPLGLAAEERARLRALLADWLRRHG